MKIAELSRVSQTHRSTIHHYANLGLLPPPEIRGPKLFLYGPHHVERLQAIRRLLRRGRTLKQIQRALASSIAPEVPPRPTAPRQRPRAVDPALRVKILAAAAELFLQHGFESVHIEDVARAVGVGKATIYRHVESKTDLFVACLEQLRHAAIGPEQRAVVQRPLEIFEEGALRARAVLARFGPYRMMTNLLTTAALSPDRALSERAKHAQHRLVTDAEPAIQRAIAAGVFRPIDSELLAYMLWGALIGAGDRMVLDDRYDVDDVVRIYIEVVGHGALAR